MINGSLRRSLGMLAAVVLVASACSNGGSSPSPAASSGGSQAAGSPAASGGAPSFGQIGGSVTVLGSWSGDEQASFMAMVKPFEDMTGVQVQYTGTRDLNTQLSAGIKSGQLPDLAGLPGPGQMAEYAQAGALKDLSSAIDVNAYKANTPQALVDLGTVNGTLVGTFIKLSVKGLIWYSPKTVGDLTSNAPKTWDDLQNLINQDKSKAQAPWCVGLESGAASGWPGTDWIEDFVLRTAGPDTYKQWYQGKVKWTDPAIKKAWQMFGDVVKQGNVYGGPDYVLTTNFANGGDKLFSTPPGCLFHHQASFITGLGGFKDLKAGTDYNFFPFPDINSQYTGSVEGAGDLFGMFHDTPQAKALMQWLVSADAQQIWVKRGGALSANKQVPDSAYPDDISKRSAQLLLNAKNFVFDGSDQMPTDMNAAFWKGILDFVKDQTKLDSILQNLDTVQASSYGS
ncbi:MAG TPA: extracellular solute-binding protein [Candidatus Limnocylindrales bacterium]